MKKILVVAPHPDDETLGCGGSIFRHIENGDQVHWLIVTKMCSEDGFDLEKIKSRDKEISLISDTYNFSDVHQLNFRTTRLDVYPVAEVVSQIGTVFDEVQPDVVYLPFRADAHSDHRIVYDACSANTKWFRSSYLNEILVYETPSETEFQSDFTVTPFRPNLYVDIAPYLNKKLDAMSLYKGESGEFPFPRSCEALEVLAKKRGVESGFFAAEAFMIIKKRY